MNPQDPSGSKFTFAKASLMPQEEMLDVSKHKQQLTIGIPKESQKYESRVALTPEAVDQLINIGHEVRIESGAGNPSNYSNTDYSELGGFIVDSREEVYKSDIILKIAPLTLDEIDLLSERQVVISSLHLNSQTKQFVMKLIQKTTILISIEKN